MSLNSNAHDAGPPLAAVTVATVEPPNVMNLVADTGPVEAVLASVTSVAPKYTVADCGVGLVSDPTLTCATRCPDASYTYTRSWPVCVVATRLLDTSHTNPIRDC